MTTPRWWSQPFPPTGAIASEGIRNQLGRPPVDPLTVFVRETAQNSWDARLPDVETTYRLDLSTVAATHRPNWERLLTPPNAIQDHLGIGRAVRDPTLRLLTVVDRGTKGLGGPIRADEVTTDRRDWVSFVLNVGEKRDTDQGGGTYGYGKAVLYRLSRVGTIIVHTRTAVGDGLQSRLIGIALGDSFDGHDRAGVTARPFTGRHWWGDVREDHVEPLIGDEADDIARSLGLPTFGFGETGTTLVVVDPDLADFDDVDHAARHLADTIAWHLWPILLPERGSNRMLAEVVATGRSVEVPDPATTYPLRMFVAAHRRLRTDRAVVLECGNPRRQLGRFALERAVVVPMPDEAITAAAAYAGVDGDPHHVCLMRSPELVVRYLPGPPTSTVHQVYAGVFRAANELDDIYATAEPPTHDNWIADHLTGHAKTYVRVTFRRILERLSVFRTPTAAAATKGGVALGAASNFLGGIVAAAFAEPDDPTAGGHGGSAVDGAEAGGTGGGGTGGGGGVAGGGATRPPTTGTGGTSGPTPARPRITPLDEPRIEERDGAVVVVARYALTGTGRARLTARLSIATWDGREDDPPAGAARPQVVAWTTPDGRQHADPCMLATPGEVELLVAPVPDTVTDIAVDITPADAS